MMKRIVRATATRLYRRVNASYNTGFCAYLTLECGHCIRESGIDAFTMQSGIDRGKKILRKCKECEMAAIDRQLAV